MYSVCILALIWLTGIPQTLKQWKSRWLLYRVQWAGRSNFTPRSRKAMQFTCPTMLLIACSVANGISAVGFLTSKICCFSQLLSHTIWRSGHLHGCVLHIHICSEHMCTLTRLQYFFIILYFICFIPTAPNLRNTLFLLPPLPFHFPNVFSFPPVLGNSIME